MLNPETAGAAEAPLTPAGCDLLNFPGMQVLVGRLLSSETWIEAARDPRLGHVLMSLWCEAWRQVPAGSVPGSDDTLQRMSMCPSDKEWRRVRERVLRDWQRCTDGRLYHPVVSELALCCWLDKLTLRRSSILGNAKKHKLPVDTREVDAHIAQSRALLARLNPHNPALQKKRAGADVVGLATPSGSAPGGTPGAAPGGSAGGLPERSQEKRRDLSPKPPDPACGQLRAEPFAAMPVAVREALDRIGSGVRQ